MIARKRLLPTLLSCFAFAFAGLALIGYFVGLTSDHSATLDYLIVEQMRVTKAGTSVYLATSCDNISEAEYNVDTQEINLAVRANTTEILLPHKEVVVALLGGGSAGLTYKSVSEMRRPTSNKFAMVFGIITGYGVGYQIGKKSAIGCGSHARYSKLIDKKNWQFYSRIKYSEKTELLDFYDKRLQSRSGDDLFSDTPLAPQPENIRMDFYTHGNFAPIMLRCSTTSSEILSAVEKSLRVGFTPSGKDFLDLQRLSSAYQPSGKSEIQKRYEEIWTKWLANGLTPEEFSSRGGLTALKGVQGLNVQTSGTKPTQQFEGEVWQDRRKTLSELERNILSPEKFGPETDVAFDLLCRELVLKIQSLGN